MNDVKCDALMVVEAVWSRVMDAGTFGSQFQAHEQHRNSAATKMRQSRAVVSAPQPACSASPSIHAGPFFHFRIGAMWTLLSGLG